MARDILHDFKSLPLEVTDNQTLLETAWQIASEYQRVFYDSLYIALAHTENCQLITADLALINALKSKLSSLLLWIEDIDKQVR